MNSDLPNDELLMHYLDGNLDEKERKLFEQELERDATLRGKLTDMQVAIEAVKQAGTAERVGKIHQQMMSELKGGKVVTKKTFSPVMKIGMSMAASLILIVATLGIYTSQLSSEKVFNKHYLDYAVSSSRGGGDRTAIDSLFAAKNYEAAVNLGSTIALSPKENLLVGISYLNLDQPAMAIAVLSGLLSDTRYQKDAEYYLGMAYLKNEEPVAAEKILEKIHDDETHPYHSKVSGALMRKVRLLRWKD